MNLLGKNFIIFYLIVSLLGAFAFHWIFVGEMMAVEECFSISCVYSPAQTIPPEVLYNFLMAFVFIFAALIFTSAAILNNKFRKIPGKIFFRWKIDGFLRKLIFWLKILEKRDPEVALVAAGFEF